MSFKIKSVNTCEPGDKGRLWKAKCDTKGGPPQRCHRIEPPNQINGNNLVCYKTRQNSSGVFLDAIYTDSTCEFSSECDSLRSVPIIGDLLFELCLQYGTSVIVLGFIFIIIFFLIIAGVIYLLLRPNKNK